MLNRFFHFFAAVAILLWSVSASFAAPSLSVSPASGNSFTVQGYNMDGVSGIELVIGYDGSLSAPAVSPGSLISAAGATFLANPAFGANKIKIAIITTKSFSGNGSISTVNFGKGSGSLRIESQNLINSSGASLNGSVTSDSTVPTFSQPGIPFSTPTPTPTSTTSTTTTMPATTSTTGTLSSTPTTLGSVNIAPDAFLKNEPKPKESVGVPVQPTSGASSTADASPQPAEQTAAPLPEESKKPENIKSTTYSGVIERFRTYQGEKSPAILAALFKKEVAPSVRQVPPVALSDGATSISIIASLPSIDAKSPNFALNGAKLVSLKRDETSADWIIEAKPQENTMKASLTILNGSEIIEFPLTVAPPLKSRKVSENDFAKFLKNPGKDSDLNGDGNYDYLDDFVYTANYLVWLETSKKDKPVQKPKK